MISSIAYPSRIYTFVFTISFWFWIIFELWVFIRERGTPRDASRDRGSTVLVMLVLTAGFALAFNLPEIAPQFNIQNFFTLFFTLGIFLIFAGILFRFWAIRTLGRFFRTRVMIQDEHRLITTGPYQYLRNPSYTAILIFLIGFGLGIGNWLSVVVLFAVGFIDYAWRIARVEEPALTARFGKEYQDYKQKTWALIPFIW